MLELILELTTVSTLESLKTSTDLTSWQENIRLRDQNNNHQTYGGYGDYKNVIATQDMSANPWTALTASFDEDQKIAYSNDERITYGGLFTQLEYSNDKMSAFFQGSNFTTVSPEI
jgi:hypothetical protein